MQFTAKKEDKECGKIVGLLLDMWSFRTCEISKKRCKRAVGVLLACLSARGERHGAQRRHPWEETYT